jgi:hypothetical protein
MLWVYTVSEPILITKRWQLEGQKNEYKPSVKLQLKGTRMLGDTFNCFILGTTFRLLPHSLGRARIGSDTHHIIVAMINEILAPDKKKMFRNKYILEKVSETLDVISTGDRDSVRPSVYWTSVRQHLQN